MAGILEQGMLIPAARTEEWDRASPSVLDGPERAGGVRIRTTGHAPDAGILSKRGLVAWHNPIRRNPLRFKFTTGIGDDAETFVDRAVSHDLTIEITDQGDAARRTWQAIT